MSVHGYVRVRMKSVLCQCLCTLYGVQTEHALCLDPVQTNKQQRTLPTGETVLNWTSKLY